MNPEEAVRVLNARSHRGHDDWIVSHTSNGTFIEIKSQPEDYVYRFTYFEAEAIALKYLALEESDEDAA